MPHSRHLAALAVLAFVLLGQAAEGCEGGGIPSEQHVIPGTAAEASDGQQPLHAAPMPPPAAATGAPSSRGTSPPAHCAAAAADDSVRCRLSGICEEEQQQLQQPLRDSGGNATHSSDPRAAGDPLACPKLAAERAAAVQEAARHAWRGYRCALLPTLHA